MGRLRGVQGRTWAALGIVAVAFVLPIPGLEASWEGWITLPTGARVATRHRVAGFTLSFTDIAAAESLEALVGPQDPFQAL